MSVLTPILRLSSLHESEVHHEQDELLPLLPHMLGYLVIEILQAFLELRVMSEELLLVLRTQQGLLNILLKVPLIEASQGEHLTGCLHLFLRDHLSWDSCLSGWQQDGW